MKPCRWLAAVVIVSFAISASTQQSPGPVSKDDAAKPATAIRFSPDGKQLITESGDDKVRIWDAQTGKAMSNLQAHLGAWQLVSSKYGDAEKMSEAPREQKRIKLITETQFTWVEYEVTSGKVQSSAGGSYTLNGDAYVETIAYAGEGMTDYLGKKQSFTIRVEGNTLHQSGQLSDGTKIEEIWQRIH